MTDDLKAIRERLDAIDLRLLDALAERQEAIRAVAAHKQQSGGGLRDITREQEQLTELRARAAARGLDVFFTTRLFNQILDHSVRVQQAHLTHACQAHPPPAAEQVRVAYQGRAGAYSEMAAEQHFGPQGVELTTHGYDSFAAILEAVADRHADYAMLPVENTTAGSINEAYDLLGRMNLTVVGEEVLRVEHCLVGLPGSSLGQIRRVFSHPQGLLQCSSFLDTLPTCSVEAFTDTAMSVMKIRDEGDPSQAAVASARAASLYQLQILARDIANQQDNYTRFMVVARSPIAYDSRIPCKTSLIFATAHAEGALLRCLDQLAKRGLNLTKLESRPRPGVPWEYLFYVDFEGNSQSENVSGALEGLKEHTSFLKVLGSYPARTTREARAAEPQRALQGRSTLTHLDPAATQTQAVAVGGIVVGGERPVLVVGPPVVETREQLRACAGVARQLGADILRAPCFMPQAAPGAYGGRGTAGLAWVQEVSEAAGLPVLVNVRDAALVSVVASVAALIEIDTDQMSNRALLEQVGRLDRPVVLRRAPDSTLATWLDAAATVAGFGNRQVILCAGAAGGTGDERTLDIAQIVRLRGQPLPVLMDPGEAGIGRGQFGSVGRACLEAGAHGLVITFQPEPDEARVRAESTLSVKALQQLVQNDLQGS